MKLFISWSGKRSQEVANLLNSWIPTVTNGIKTWVSTRDIESGAQWFNEITQNLVDTTQGIFCLTNENKDKPWILFEAGALVKGSSKARVRTLLIDLKTEEIKDPLAQFNHTFPTSKESMLQLIKGINKNFGDAEIPEQFLEPKFEKEWPTFINSFNEIIKTTEVSTKPSAPPSPANVLSDILEVVRGIDKQVASLSNMNDSVAAQANTHSDIQTILAYTHELMLRTPNGVSNAISLITPGQVRLTAAAIGDYLRLNSQANSFLYKLSTNIDKATNSAFITSPLNTYPPVAMLRELGINTIDNLDSVLKENQKQIVLFASNWVNRAERPDQVIHFSDFPLYVLIYLLLSEKSKDYIKTFFEDLGIFSFPGINLAAWNMPNDSESLSTRVIQLGELTKANLAINQVDKAFNAVTYIERLRSDNYEAHLSNIYDKIYAKNPLGSDISEQFIKEVLDSERAIIGLGSRMIINHLIFVLIYEFKKKAGIELAYSNVEKYATDHEAELGPFVRSA